MLSVFLRASAIIAVIFFHSPHRADDGGALSQGLRRGFDPSEARGIEVPPLARLWNAVPADRRADVAGAVARDAASGWLRPVLVEEKAAELDEPHKAAGPLWRDGPVREARRVYP